MYGWVFCSPLPWQFHLVFSCQLSRKVGRSSQELLLNISSIQFNLVFIRKWLYILSLSHEDLPMKISKQLGRNWG